MPYSDRPKASGDFYVAFDGSGTIGQHLATVYAGGVTTMRQWAAFSEMWEGLLRKHDLAYFKMAEAMKTYGEFLPKATKLGKDFDTWRDETVSQFANLKNRYDVRVVGCGYSVGTTGVSPYLPADKTAMKKKRIFQDAVLALLKGIPADANVYLLCDIEKDVEETFRGWIDSLGKTHPANMARILGISFLDDKFSIPIQFADMVAWVARNEVERMAIHPEEPIHPLYTLLMERSDVTLEVMNPDGIRSGTEHKL